METSLESLIWVYMKNMPLFVTYYLHNDAKGLHAAVIHFSMTRQKSSLKKINSLKCLRQKTTLKWPFERKNDVSESTFISSAFIWKKQICFFNNEV